MSTVTVATAAELSSALSKASAGTEIRLAPGFYGDVDVEEIDVGGSVTLTSANPGNPATIGRLYIHESRNIIVEDLDFAAAGPGDQVGLNGRLSVDLSQNVTLRGLDITGVIPNDATGVDPYGASTGRSEPISGWPFDYGVTVRNSSNVTLEDSMLSELRIAASVRQSKNVTLQDLEITEVREGINFTDSQSLTITGNYFHDFNPWIGTWEPDRDGDIHDHADMIQYWGTNSQTGLSDITISKNVFEMPPGEFTQTVFGHMHTAPAGVIAEGFTVTDNLILNAQFHGITLAGVQSGLVANNVILPNIEQQFGLDVPTIYLPDGAANITLRGNVVVDPTGNDVLDMSAAEMARQNITVTSDNLVLSNTPLSNDYWADWWADQNLPAMWSKWVSDPVAATDPGGATQTVQGSGGSDAMNGTPVSELFISGAGDVDRMWGGAGDAPDYFLVGNETRNGKLEWDQIQGFDWRYDALVLGNNTTVDRTGSPEVGRVTVRYNGDDDGMTIWGAGLTTANLTILTYAEFLAGGGASGGGGNSGGNSGGGGSSSGDTDAAEPPDDTPNTPPDTPVDGGDVDLGAGTPVYGTNGPDSLSGTSASEIFYSGAGTPDRLQGGSGNAADYFYFGSETRNGQYDSDRILDFQWRYDAIVLGDGAAIDRMSGQSDRVSVRFEGDDDLLTIFGDGVTTNNLTVLQADDLDGGASGGGSSGGSSGSETPDSGNSGGGSGSGSAGGDVSGFTAINGTANGDTLDGTSAAEIFYSGAGTPDRMTGGSGNVADYFYFGSETDNGQYDSDRILDFQWQYDAVVLGDGAAIDRMSGQSDRVSIRFEGDDDLLTIFGDGVTTGNLKVLEADDLDGSTSGGASGGGSGGGGSSNGSGSGSGSSNGFAVINGTSDYDTLDGTSAAEVFYSGAGTPDRMTGGSGNAADYFVFGAETDNGQYDSDRILDFQWQYDAIVLADGAAIDRMSGQSDRVSIRFEGDDDLLTIFGDGVTTGNLTILTMDEAGLA